MPIIVGLLLIPLCALLLILLWYALLRCATTDRPLDVIGHANDPRTNEES